MAATWRIRSPFFALRTAFFLAAAIPKSDQSGIPAVRYPHGKTSLLQIPKPPPMQAGALPTVSRLSKPKKEKCQRQTREIVVPIT
ncbi:hypothetical protein [Mesorhizobium sp. WSM3862]|uniref:hypothetical protein n=1 Tax=Mesorhizobium sp. WSM3862 TaxID=632858 RepID=UPI001596D846|nr:hypothetical protein [Mesorhizobium sp. WSM3862]